MKKDEDISQDIKSYLDQTIDELDNKTATKIRAIRRETLELGESRWSSWGFPLTGIASAVLAVIIALTVFKTPVTKINPAQFEVLELLSSEHDLDLYENLEFFTWLAENSEENLGS